MFHVPLGFDLSAENAGCKPWRARQPTLFSSLMTSCCWKEVSPPARVSSPSCRNQRTGWPLFHSTWPSPPFLGFLDSCRKPEIFCRPLKAPCSPTACPAPAPPWLVKHPSPEVLRRKGSVWSPQSADLMSCCIQGHAKGHFALSL